jgi:hypothetical protein
VLISFGVHDADEGHLCLVRLERMRPVSVDKSERTSTLDLRLKACHSGWWRTRPAFIWECHYR